MRIVEDRDGNPARALLARSIRLHFRLSGNRSDSTFGVQLCTSWIGFRAGYWDASSACVALLPLLLSAAFSLRAAVNDIYPGDYFLFAPGGSTASLYVMERHQNGPYVQSQKAVDHEIALRYQKAF